MTKGIKLNDTENMNVMAKNGKIQRIFEQCETDKMKLSKDKNLMATKAFIK